MAGSTVLGGVVDGVKTSIYVLPGQRFGRLTVVDGEHRLPLTESQRRFGKTVGARAAILQCDCGNGVSARLADLVSGRQVSCGCWRDDSSRSRMTEWRQENTHPGYVDGRSSHYLYPTWHAMVRRCTDPRHSSFAHYGARGISVFEEWRKDPISFFRWVDDNLGLRPAGQELDRIDNDGNYEPGNVQWATREQQIENSSLGRDSTTGRFGGSRERQ